MAVANVFIAVVLCTVGYSASFSLRKVAEGLTSRQLRRSDDLLLPTVSPALNPGDAGVQEWPDEFRPDIMSAFELLKSKRAATAEGEDQKPSGGGGFPFVPTVPSQFENYAKPFTNYTDISQYQQNFTQVNGNQFTQFVPTGNPMQNYTNMNQINQMIPTGNPMQNYTDFNQMIPTGNPMQNYTNMNQINQMIPTGNPMQNYTNFNQMIPTGNPIQNYTNMNQINQMIPTGNPMQNYTNMNQVIPNGNIPFVNGNNNGNQNPEGDKPSKRSADYSSKIAYEY